MKTVSVPNVMNIYLAGLEALHANKKAILAAFPTLNGPAHKDVKFAAPKTAAPALRAC